MLSSANASSERVKCATAYSGLKQIPNVKLISSTFDALHLDKFLKNEFFEKTKTVANVNELKPLPKNQHIGQFTNIR